MPEQFEDNQFEYVLRQRLEKLTVERSNLHAELVELNREIRNLKRAMTLLGFPPENGAKSRKNSTGNKWGVNLATTNANRIREVFVKHMSDEHTAESISEDSGISHSSVSKYLSAMRETGEIDLVRKGGRTGSLRFYKYHG